MRLVARGYSLLPLQLLFVTFVSGAARGPSAADDGALYLTPLIRAGRTGEARAACRTKLPGAADVESCSGYLTVDDAHGSNMFFWFFSAMNGAPDAPVLLWLQGGPGASSLYAVFNEHGPFSVRRDVNGLEPRDHAWTANYSVLYVDNPVGTGYSFTGDDAGYSSDQTAVGLNLYTALVQFFALFPEYRKNDFYVTGESYAGKYVPAVSYAIHLNNPNAPVKINLKGLAIGNGLIDPINQLVHSEYLYQHGFVDEYGKRKFEDLENVARGQIVSGDFKAAVKTYEDMVLSDINYPYPSLFNNLTGMSSYFNLMKDRDPSMNGDWERYVQQPSVRDALHVGQRPWNNASAVSRHMADDIMRSVSPWLAALLDAGRYRVLLYSGQMDIILPYVGTTRVVQQLQWSGADSFKNAKRTVWRVQNKDGKNTTDVAGYSNAFGPLTVVLIRNAGHMVPMDQPAWANDLIDRFTAGRPF